ncbi:MAG: 2,3-bisphosphoglycerate-independent phosphoglycerate mutase, partial [Patescibacteria group bacterium]|nr:2,3-bisphosphoglycerate-independent phosphoglycerate mutase [Patescibacteria group bacterium]
MHNPKVILVIMDGWGYSPVKKGNAIFAAKTPNFDYLWNNYSHTLLNSFGENVGLPWGSIGSSEVGHTSIGSGKLINQELSLIDKDIIDGGFYKNQKILKIINTTKESGNSIHLAGLVSNGGVHSQMEHLFAILRLLKNNGVKSN